MWCVQNARLGNGCIKISRRFLHRFFLNGFPADLCVRMHQKEASVPLLSFIGCFSERIPETFEAYFTHFRINFGMILFENTTDLPFDPEPLESIARTLTQQDLELILCDESAIRELNRAHRRTDRATDVLSFPLEGDLPHQPLGTVVISADHAREASTRLGHSPDDEIALLFTHGLLHLLGYDHETDTGQMRRKEQEILEHFRLPESLIVRTEGA